MEPQRISKTELDLAIQGKDISKTNKPKKTTDKKVLITKILFLSIVLACFAMFIYSIVLLVKDTSTSTGGDESYIALKGKNEKDSEKIYSEYGNEKQNKGGDFSIIGTKFFFSESKITPSLLSSSNSDAIFGEGRTNFYLYKLVDNVFSSSWKTISSEGIYYIDLNLLDDGDYVIFSDTTHEDRKSINPYSLSSNTAINYVSYSLPNENGERKRITIRNNKVSPFLIINVLSCGTTLPDEYYDAVLLYQEYYIEDEKLVKKDVSEKKDYLTNSILPSIDDKFKVKVVSSIQEAFDANANLAFSIGEIDLTSLYTNYQYQTKTYESGSLIGYDYYPEIRELTGYLDNAGKHYPNVICNDTVISENKNIGKESFMFVDNSETIVKIDSILNR